MAGMLTAWNQHDASSMQLASQIPENTKSMFDQAPDPFGLNQR